METIRRQFTPEQKVAIVREHLLESRPVSDVCEQHQIQPTLFYQWQRTFFENGAAAFVPKRPTSQALAGCSRFLVHWELRQAMTEADVEILLQRAREKHPEAKPRIISDNGPQFIARDCKEFIRMAGITPGRTSPYYPQSNGKIERWHRSLKSKCIRPGVPLCLEDARRLVHGFVEHDNRVRLHSAIGYLTPSDKLCGRASAIFAARDKKLLLARAQRKTKRLHTQPAA